MFLYHSKFHWHINYVRFVHYPSKKFNGLDEDPEKGNLNY